MEVDQSLVASILLQSLDGSAGIPRSGKRRES